MGGAPTPNWDPIGFDPQPPMSACSYSAHLRLRRSTLSTLCKSPIRQVFGGQMTWTRRSALGPWRTRFEPNAFWAVAFWVGTLLFLLFLWLWVLKANQKERPFFRGGGGRGAKTRQPFSLSVRGIRPTQNDPPVYHECRLFPFVACWYWEWTHYTWKQPSLTPGVCRKRVVPLGPFNWRHVAF